MLFDNEHMVAFRENQKKTKMILMKCQFCGLKLDKPGFSCGDSSRTTKDYFCDKKHYLRWFSRRFQELNK